MIRRTTHLIVSVTFLALTLLSSQGAQVIIASTTSGHVIYGEGAIVTPRHRRWNGAGFDGETSAVAANDIIQWVVAKTSPTAAEMTMGVLSDRNNEIHIQTWDGSTWTANWTAN